MTEQDQENGRPQHRREVPDDPRARPTETVEALDEAAQGDTDEQGVAAEDVTENPDTDELAGLPGPSPDEPGEPTG